MYKMTPQQQALARLYRRGNLLTWQLTPGDNDTLREIEALTKQITAAVDELKKSMGGMSKMPEPKTIEQYIVAVHDNAVRKGFWDKRRETGTLLMLIVSELAEALEADRHGDRANFEEELADVAIRLFDLCGGIGIDLELEIDKKMAINAGRPQMHGKAY